jgi:hypothetical protein
LLGLVSLGSSVNGERHKCLSDRDIKCLPPVRGGDIFNFLLFLRLRVDLGHVAD